MMGWTRGLLPCERGEAWINSMSLTAGWLREFFNRDSSSLCYISGGGRHSLNDKVMTGKTYTDERTLAWKMSFCQHDGWHAFVREDRLTLTIPVDPE